MAKTKIEWTWYKNQEGTLIKGYTFNIVLGCVEVAPECDNCYAREFLRIYKKAEWGKDTQRVLLSDAYWKKPLTWQKQLAKKNQYAFVFCSSFADVFERNATVAEQRVRLFELIRQTPNLIWLLLTKRVNNIVPSLPADWGNGYPNVWLGTTCGTQRRVPEVERLGRIPAVKRFVSVEPLLEQVDFGTSLDAMDWVIFGGESGAKARRMDEAWLASGIEQAQRANCAVFVKQMGAVWAKAHKRKGDSHGIDKSYWRDDFRIQQHPLFEGNAQC